ncbi:MAG: metalloregulator ArsR/SmtB family transcription factor [Vicinamibacterales bacterium]
MQRFTDEQLTLVARRGRALGDVTHVRILDVLGRAEQPIGMIAVAIESEPSTISKHLQVLFHAGFVLRRRAANAVIYSIADAELLDWCRYLGAARLESRSQRT